MAVRRFLAEAAGLHRGVEHRKIVLDRIGSISGLEDLALGVHEEDGGISPDFVFFGEFPVLLLELFGLFFLPRVIELDDDEVFLRSFDEFIFGENVFVKSLAGWAPVGAGEDDKEGLLVFGGFDFGGFEVGFEFSGGGKAHRYGGGEGDGDVLDHSGHQTSRGVSLFQIIWEFFVRLPATTMLVAEANSLTFVEDWG